MDQVRESRITADRIELWIGFDELEDIGLLPVGQFEPIKGLFVVAGAQVCIHKCAGGNIAGLPALFQFREQPQRVTPPTGVRVCPDQPAGYSGAAFRECFGLVHIRTASLR